MEHIKKFTGYVEPGFLPPEWFDGLFALIVYEKMHDALGEYIGEENEGRMPQKVFIEIRWRETYLPK